MKILRSRSASELFYGLRTIGDRADEIAIEATKNGQRLNKAVVDRVAETVVNLTQFKVVSEDPLDNSL